MKIDLFSIGRFTIHGYGLMIAIGIICCVLMAEYRAKKYQLSADAIVDIAIWGVVAGFLGAKLLYVIVEFPTFMKDPKSILGSEGFVVYGGITAGVVAAILYCRIKKLKFLAYFDLAAPSISLAQGFGRLGCLMAGCCYGRETNSPFGIVFPEGCMAPAGVKLIPTQIISSAGDFLITAILLLYYRKNKEHGKIGALYMVLYGVGRFLVEFLRNDERGGWGIFSTSQWISFLIVAGGGILFLKKEKKTETGEEKETEE